ncbi:MAG: hypothetical protein WKF87_21095 [Chryseolinea sp.]
MGLKIFKALWFLSMLAVLANLLFTYMSLPENVVIRDDGEARIALPRDSFFYIMTALLAIVNVMVYFISRIFKKDFDFRAWFHGLVITLNIFFIISMNFIGLFNSGERFDYKRIDFIIYGSLGLFLIWTLAWPIYAAYKKFLIKATV